MVVVIGRYRGQVICCGDCRAAERKTDISFKTRLTDQLFMSLHEHLLLNNDLKMISTKGTVREAGHYLP